VVSALKSANGTAPISEGKLNGARITFTANGVRHRLRRWRPHRGHGAGERRRHHEMERDARAGPKPGA
jgi:hypothetical protein